MSEQQGYKLGIFILMFIVTLINTIIAVIYRETVKNVTHCNSDDAIQNKCREKVLLTPAGGDNVGVIFLIISSIILFLLFVAFAITKGNLIISYWPYTGFVLGIASLLSMFMAWFLHFRIYNPPDSNDDCAKCYDNIKNHTIKYNITPDICKAEDEGYTCFKITDKELYAHAVEPSTITLVITTIVTVIGFAGVFFIKKTPSIEIQ